MTRPTILITGATDGIGRETALTLAKRDIRLIVHGRDGGRGEELLERLEQLNPQGEFSFIRADFASLDQVREMASTLLSTEGHLDVMVNNAGLFAKKRELTDAGCELTFTVNHLAPFLLTNLLLDLLKKSAPSRIVNVASMAHRTREPDFDNLNGEQRFDGYSAYALSKQANILFTYALARRLRESEVTVHTLHPGVIDTKLLRDGWGGFGGASVADGAKAILHLATGPEGGKESGRYFAGLHETRSGSVTYDEALQERMWRRSCELVGEDFP